MTYTMCKACQQILLVTFLGQETHPACPDTDTEKLARDFVDAVQRGDDDADRLERLLNKPAAAPLRGSALWYASIGWPVFPLQAGGKQPAISRHDGGNGLYDATTDAEQIRRWWTANPEYNIGLPTGKKFDVIDIDGPEGVESLSRLGDDVLPDVHGRVTTPRGLHLYVAATGDGNRAGVRPGIDYRGAGGYVVAPPSRIEFKRYQWAVQPSPEIRAP